MLPRGTGRARQPGPLACPAEPARDMLSPEARGPSKDTLRGRAAPCGRELEHPCSIPITRYPWVPSPPVLVHRRQSRSLVLGQVMPLLSLALMSLHEKHASCLALHLLCCRGQMQHPLPALPVPAVFPRPGCSWQLQQSPVGMCQAGDSCQPGAHLCQAHGKRGELHGPWARGRQTRGAQHPERPQICKVLITLSWEHSA